MDWNLKKLLREQNFCGLILLRKKAIKGLENSLSNMICTAKITVVVDGRFPNLVKERKDIEVDKSL